MTQYNALNVKLSNSQLNNKSGIKNNTEVTLKISSNFVGDDEYNLNIMMNIIFLINC